jgi:hypothetical protein
MFLDYLFNVAISRFKIVLNKTLPLRWVQLKVSIYVNGEILFIAKNKSDIILIKSFNSIDWLHRLILVYKKNFRINYPYSVLKHSLLTL